MHAWSVDPEDQFVRVGTIQMRAGRLCHRRMNTPHIGRLNFPQFEA